MSVENTIYERVIYILQAFDIESKYFIFHIYIKAYNTSMRFSDIQGGKS